MAANNGPSSLDPNDLKAVSSEDVDNEGKKVKSTNTFVLTHAVLYCNGICNCKKTNIDFALLISTFD
jgi:hypothetical protein